MYLSLMNINLMKFDELKLDERKYEVICVNENKKILRL